jgi:hypothetical protein
MLLGETSVRSFELAICSRFRSHLINSPLVSPKSVVSPIPAQTEGAYHLVVLSAVAWMVHIDELDGPRPCGRSGSPLLACRMVHALCWTSSRAHRVFFLTKNHRTRPLGGALSGRSVLGVASRSEGYLGRPKQHRVEEG